MRRRAFAAMHGFDLLRGLDRDPRSCHVSGRGDICTATKTVAIRSLRRPPFAERDTLWMLCRSVRQSGLAPENFTTLAHFSISKRIEIARGKTLWAMRRVATIHRDVVRESDHEKARYAWNYRRCRLTDCGARF